MEIVIYKELSFFIPAILVNRFSPTFRKRTESASEQRLEHQTVCFRNRLLKLIK
ncbi:hypothetical protein D9M69_655250 [compost metagenome]